MTATTFWISLGFIGQGLFGLRILIQWLASERAGASVVPPVFWYISAAAGLLLFSYVTWRRNPVFMLNEGICLMIFMRNIFMLHKAKKNHGSRA